MSLADEARVMSALLEFYTAAEAEQWFGLPHPQLDNERPIDVIWDGRVDAVLATIERLRADGYL